MELKTGADSGVCLKKRHYGKHRSSLLYGGFVDAATKSHDVGLVTNDKDLSKEVVPKKLIQERCVIVTATSLLACFNTHTIIN